MAVVVYALGGMTPQRASALGATQRPAWLAVPNVDGPSVALYSDELNRWSDPYLDNGSLTSAAWAGDPILAQDTATTNGRSLESQARNAIAVNQTYLALGAPSNAQNTAQVRALTRQANALIRLAIGALDSTAGT